MLPQIGSTELLVIAALALIVIGPKDLPVLLRKLGQFVGRLRGMANEFRSSFDEMARQSELDDLRKEVAAMRESAAAEKAAVEQNLASLNGSGFPGGEYGEHAEYGEMEPELTVTLRKREPEVEADPAKPPRKARKPKAEVHHTIHDHLQTPPMATPDYDPESYLRYPESTAEKVLNRRKKVAEAEAKASKPKAVKASAPKPPAKPRKAKT